ncbi:MAG: hypothetical protein ACP5HP_05720, partial [Thermogladius sp.]
RPRPYDLQLLSPSFKLTINWEKEVTIYPKPEENKEELNKLEERGFEVSENKTSKPLLPDLTAWKDEKKIGVWVIDPSADRATQLKNLYLAIGSSMVDQSYDGYFIVMPQDLADKLSDRVKGVLESFNTKIIILKEEKKYTLLI